MTKIQFIAKALRALVQEEESPEELTEANEDLEILLWDSSIEPDRIMDSTVEQEGYRGPHYTNRTVFRPLRITLDNTKPPRAVRR